MSATAQQTVTKIDKADFQQATRHFDISHYTEAPLRLQGTYQFNASAETVFNKLTDPQLIAGWFGMVKGGSVDHSQSCNSNDWGEGSKRYCETSMGKLDETIYFWQAPYITAYNVKSWSMPIKDHCAVLTVEPMGEKKCRIIWSQHFNYKGLVMRNIFPHMMRKMMDDGLQTLTKELGGNGGSVKLL